MIFWVGPFILYLLKPQPVAWIVGKHTESGYDLEYIAQSCNQNGCTPIKSIKHVEFGYFLDLCRSDTGHLGDCDKESILVSKEVYNSYLIGMEYPKLEDRK